MNRPPRLAPTPLLVPMLLALAGTPTRAQDTASTQLVDRVIAVVGDSMILQSELDEEIINNFAMGRPLPEDPATLERLRREALDQLVSELLFVQAAARDSVTVPDEEIRSAVDAEIARRQRAMGGEAAFIQALSQARLTLAEYREILTRDARRQRTVQYYLATLQRSRRPPPVTEEEVRAFFEAQKDMLGKRPASLTFEQVVVAPRPSDSARAAARERALEILRELREGADFATLARRHSDDPGTREQGGELGWFRRGDMVPQFDSAAFALRPGELSGVVESAFGFHIIRLDRVRGAERQARHILIRPDLTEADLQRAPELAREVAARARAGEPMAALAEQFGAPDEQTRVEVSRDRLPNSYDTELADAEAGAVIGPFRLPGDGGPDRWAVVKVLEVVPEGEYSLDDPRVHAMVREQLEYQKLLEEVLDELRRRVHVDIRL